MLKPGAWLLAPLLFLPVEQAAAQDPFDPGVLPPPLDTTVPVPMPEMLPAATASLTPEMPEALKINNQGGRIEGDPESGLRLGGPVRIEGDNGLEIFSDTANLDLKAKTVTLTGNVTVYQGNVMRRGDTAVYHYETRYLDSSGLRASMDPVLLEAGKFTSTQVDGRQVMVGQDAGITTHDAERPGFWIRARKTTVYPDDKIVFNHLKLYAGETPVFWLPYLSQPLDAELGYHYEPGARSNWGPYLLNSYGIMLGGETDPQTGENKDAWLLSRWHLDLRASRGIGMGVDLSDTRAARRPDMPGLSLYYLNDMDPAESRNGVPRGAVGENRYKAELRHRVSPDLPDGAEWNVDANLTMLSDRHFLEDFEMDRYHYDPAPDNTLGIHRRDDASLLTLYGRFRVNDFYRADTRYPELSHDRARAPFFGLPVLHEGTTSLGYIGEQAADITRSAIIDPLSSLSAGSAEATRLLDQLGGYERRLAERMINLPAGDPQREAIRTQLLDSGYGRFHTYQEWSLPMMLGGFLSITPEAGAGYTRYGAVEGPENGSDDIHLHVGVESSVKFSRNLGDIRNRSLGLDGLKHVIQPYGTWSIVSTNDFTAGDPGVDRLTPTTRPRPIDPMRTAGTCCGSAPATAISPGATAAATNGCFWTAIWMCSSMTPRATASSPISTTTRAGSRCRGSAWVWKRSFRSPTAARASMNSPAGSIGSPATVLTSTWDTAGSTATRCWWTRATSTCKHTSASARTGASAHATRSSSTTALSKASNTPCTGISATGWQAWASAPATTASNRNTAWFSA
jgi:hypothetical protein